MYRHTKWEPMMNNFFLWARQQALQTDSQVISTLLQNIKIKKSNDICTNLQNLSITSWKQNKVLKIKICLQILAAVQYSKDLRKKIKGERDKKHAFKKRDPFLLIPSCISTMRIGQLPANTFFSPLQTWKNVPGGRSLGGWWMSISFPNIEISCFLILWGWGLINLRCTWLMQRFLKNNNNNRNFQKYGSSCAQEIMSRTEEKRSALMTKVSHMERHAIEHIPSNEKKIVIH